MARARPHSKGQPHVPRPVCRARVGSPPTHLAVRGGRLAPTALLAGWAGLELKQATSLVCLAGRATLAAPAAAAAAAAAARLVNFGQPCVRCLGAALEAQTPRGTTTIAPAPTMVRATAEPDHVRRRTLGRTWRRAASCKRAGARAARNRSSPSSPAPSALCARPWLTPPDPDGPKNCYVWGRCTLLAERLNPRLWLWPASGPHSPTAG